MLFAPEIPQNTGNISRTCAVTGASLHLIKPLGFDISDRALKRAGLDYWSSLDLHIYENPDEFFAANTEGNFFYFTTKAYRRYTDVSYAGKVYLVFGRETAGLPEELLLRHEKECVRIPMSGSLRSLNLSNSVAIGVYEALRQNDFEGMNCKGTLFTEGKG